MTTATRSLHFNPQGKPMHPLIIRATLLRQTYGVAYLYSWTHRLSGISLFLFVWFHVYTLSSLQNPFAFSLKMEGFRQPAFRTLEALLAFPVIFHALNGGRLILYEVFGNRQDQSLMKWVATLTGLYFVPVLWLTYLGDFSIPSPTWIVACGGSLAAAGVVLLAMRASRIGYAWKLQRMSGAFLLVMIPLHFVLMHVNPSAGHDVGTILERIRSDILIRLADLLILISALYHGGYGLVSIVKDCTTERFPISYVSVPITIVSIGFGLLGARTIITL